VATKKTTMSAEEKAVRDALAVVNADTGVKQAQNILSSAGYNPLSGMTATAPGSTAPNVVYDPLSGMTATAPGSTAPNVAYDPLSGKVIPGQTSIGEYVNAPTTSGSNVIDPATQFKKDQEDKSTKDAYAIIEDTLNSYGLSSLASVIKGYMLSGLGPEQAKLQIKQDPIYKARFRGNQVRLDSGLNALSEAEYLGLEDTYSQVMKQYGLGDYFGKTREARQTKLADVIGGDISAVELKSRISTVVDRVNNADPAIKAQLKEFYPGITETDLVKYFLDPKETLPQLQEKVTSAEIGAAAISQKLDTSVTSATDLAKYGIDRAAAIKGYSTIGGMLPETTKLNDIYGEAKINYTQTTAEQEVFKGNASAERKRKQLAALETAQFGGSAGLGSAGLSTQMLRKSSSGGQF
jgi:hypothetical protein